MTKKISVIIPTYNSYKTLLPCVKSILDQTLKPYEVIVVDNASVDGSWEKLLQSNLVSEIKIYRNAKNLGVTGGRNRGIKEASKKSDYLFFFDHDMIADKKMLKELVNTAEDENAGIVTPKIYYLSDKTRIWSAGTAVNLWTGQTIFRGGRDRGQYEKSEEVAVAPAAILAKWAVVDKLRNFDDRYFATYEDTDFSFRAKKVGFKVYYSPKAVAYHDLSTDPNKEAERLLSRGYLVGKNRVLFMKDFGKNFFVFLCFLPVYVFYYAKMGLKHNNFKGIGNFVRGTIEGILSRHV